MWHLWQDSSAEPSSRTLLQKRQKQIALENLPKAQLFEEASQDQKDVPAGKSRQQGRTPSAAPLPNPKGLSRLIHLVLRQELSTKTSLWFLRPPAHIGIAPW